MRVYYSDKFADRVKNFSDEMKKTLKKKLDIMLDNPQHPSLRTKKIQGKKDIDTFSALNLFLNLRLYYLQVFARKYGLLGHVKSERRRRPVPG